MTAGAATCLAERAAAILVTADPPAKAALARQVAAAWRAGEIAEVGSARPPARPARPERPLLKRPGEVPRRKINRGKAGRGALLHALAHIELNAVDLAADIIERRQPLGQQQVMLALLVGHLEPVVEEGARQI